MTREIRYRHHSLAVSNWMERALSKADVQLILKEFENLLNQLLERIGVSIGTTTLAAVWDRVVYNSALRFELLNEIEITNNRITVSRLYDTGISADETSDAFHLLTTELLATIGNLTAETVTPILHSVLHDRKETK